LDTNEYNTHNRLSVYSQVLQDHSMFKWEVRRQDLKHRVCQKLSLSVQVSLSRLTNLVFGRSSALDPIGELTTFSRLPIRLWMGIPFPTPSVSCSGRLTFQPSTEEFPLFLFNEVTTDERDSKSYNPGARTGPVLGWVFE